MLIDARSDLVLGSVSPSVKFSRPQPWNSGATMWWTWPARVEGEPCRVDGAVPHAIPREPAPRRPLRTHGVQRLSWYLKWFEEGICNPAAPITTSAVS